MSIDTHRNVIRRYFEEVWNNGDLDVLDALIAPDYVNHSPSTANPPLGPVGLKPIVAAMRTAFPDLHYTIDDQVYDGERAAIRCTLSGTHTGDFFGTPPTGKSFRVSQFQIERFRNGQIVEHWRQTDELGLMRQLGLLPG
jgi:steroid delta-isomerase-like uncharacterized protein